MRFVGHLTLLYQLYKLHSFEYVAVIVLYVYPSHSDGKRLDTRRNRRETSIRVWGNLMEN
jgi:hypothetical protein